MAKLIIGLGSNLGDRHGTLQGATVHLSERLGPVLYASNIVESVPWGVGEQPSFLNQVVQFDYATAGILRGSTIREALHHILDHCQTVEAHFGRVRGMRWGPRTLDVDVLFLSDVVYEDGRISLPHPWWRERSFVRDLLPADADRLVFDAT